MQRSPSTSQRYLALVYGTQRLVNSSPHPWGRKYRRGHADLQLRVLNANTEWTLDKLIFATAISKLGVSPNIDLFASRLIQVQPYVSFHPDPGAFAFNAFHMSWKPYLSYILQPFCLISRILQKIQEEKATVVAIIPQWPTQIWWPHLIHLLIRHPIIIPNTKTTVYLLTTQDQALVDNNNLCPVERLKQHLDKTSTTRGLHTQLLLGYQMPHRPVSTDTIAHSLRLV